MLSEPGERNGWKIRFYRKTSPYMCQHSNESCWIQFDASTDIHSTVLRQWWSLSWWAFVICFDLRCRWWCNDNNFNTLRALHTLKDWDISSASSELACSHSTLECIISNIIRTWVCNCCWVCWMLKFQCYCRIGRDPAAGEWSAREQPAFLAIPNIPDSATEKLAQTMQIAASRIRRSKQFNVRL